MGIVKKTLTGLLGATALVGAFTFFTLDEYLFWRPSSMQEYEFDEIQRRADKHISRVISEEASKIVLKNALGPVSSSVLMDETLSAYRDVRKAHGAAAGVVMAIDVMALWDAEAMKKFEESLGLGISKARYPAVHTEIYQEKMEKARGARNFLRATPKRPAAPGKWAPVLGAKDTDIGGGSMPFSNPGIIMPDVPRPFPFMSEKDKVDIALVALATRIATHEQKLNSVFWQGSRSFNKGTNIPGLNPSDTWQNIFFAETAGKISEDAYVEISAGLAAVLRDASIAAWKVKYRDWTLRPSMRLPKLEASIGNPSFPGYVSGHATIAAAAAAYLGEKDRASKGIYEILARDSEKSRFFGGVHTPSDNYVGFMLGREIAAQHLGRKGPGFEEVLGGAGRIRLAMGISNGLLDAIDGAKSRLRRTLSRGKLSFEVADSAPPAPRAKPGVLVGNDVMKGAIAAADLDGDGLPELLMSGHYSVRLYSNDGKMGFIQAGEYETAELNGAYFTRNSSGEVDGFWEFGTTVPRWHRRTGVLEFDRLGKTPSGFSQDLHLNIKGMILEDLDGDGDEDAVFLNYDDLVEDDGFVEYAGEGLQNIAVHRGGDDFTISEDDWGWGRSFAGGLFDIDGDGDKERIVVNDGAPVEIEGSDLPRAERVAGDVSGMSFSPVRVGTSDALHVSSIFTGKSDLYEGRTAPQGKETNVDGDLLIAAREGELIDISEGSLQTGALQWSWGSQAGDLNGDGLEDLVVVHGFTPNLPYECGVRILLQTDEGRFSPSGIELKIGEFYPRGLLLRDLDGDGDLDILMSSANRSQVWENTSQIKPGARFDEGRPAITGFLTQNIR